VINNTVLRLPQCKENRLVILESLTHLSSPTSPGRPTHSFKARHTNKSTQGRLKSVNQNSKLISVHCRVILEHFTVYSFNS